MPPEGTGVRKVVQAISRPCNGSTAFPQIIHFAADHLPYLPALRRWFACDGSLVR